ncbi:hypothetical protein VQL36_02885 [Chengkuizengella sp. SCS-71B]|uniref:hypothetical protein n=1 Tax=Chengkuizengella sp. SCS-71B TaxID=3115290 RepID=UPI0032C226D7
MAAFKKETEKICDFRNEEIELELTQEVVILEVKVCVKDKEKAIKLDWSVDEELSASTSAQNTAFINVTVEYRLFRNDKQIGSTINSQNQSSVGVDNLAPDNLIRNSFLQHTQPNFTFCDETPDIGINLYQVTATLKSVNGTFFSAIILDRSLIAVY